MPPLNVTDAEIADALGRLTAALKSMPKQKAA
jgi:hypothetical protein